MLNQGLLIGKSLFKKRLMLVKKNCPCFRAHCQLAFANQNRTLAGLQALAMLTLKIKEASVAFTYPITFAPNVAKEYQDFMDEV